MNIRRVSVWKKGNMDQLLEKAAHGEAIHFSDLLRNIPSDDILSKLFFNLSQSRIKGF